MNNNDQDFAWHVHGHLNNYIKFGDTKAALIAGLAGPLVFGLMGFTSWQSTWDSASLFGWLAMAAFAAAFCFAFAAIWPNLLTIRLKLPKSRKQSIEAGGKAIPDKGFIYWKNILAFPNANVFAKEMLNLTEEQKLKHIGHHCYELAGINDRKYWLITVASRCFAVGVVAITIFAAFHFGATESDSRQGTRDRASQSQSSPASDSGNHAKLDLTKK